MPAVNPSNDRYLATTIKNILQRLTNLEGQQNGGVRDAQGNIRVKWGMQSDGTYGLWIFDPAGNLQVSLGDLGGGTTLGPYGVAVLPAGAAYAGPSSLQRVGGWVESQVLSQQSYSLTSWGDTSPAGPTVSVPIGHSGEAMVTISSQISSGGYSAGETAYAGLSVDGGSPTSYPSVSAGTTATTSVTAGASTQFLVTGLAPNASHSFHMQYKVTTAGVVGYFGNNVVVVQPL
jgi:hypothetical protein